MAVRRRRLSDRLRNILAAFAVLLGFAMVCGGAALIAFTVGSLVWIWLGIPPLAQLLIVLALAAVILGSAIADSD